MDGVQQFHPLDRLIGNRTLSFLEAMVPFVDYPFKKPLVMFIKYQELMCIFRSLDNRSLVDECGFNCHPKSTEDMITDMCKFLPGNYAGSIKQMRQMMQMMETMNMAGGGNPFGNSFGNGENNGAPDMSKVFQMMQSMNAASKEHQPSHETPSYGWEPPPHDEPPYEREKPPHGWESSYERETPHDRHSLYDSVLSILDEDNEHNESEEFI